MGVDLPAQYKLSESLPFKKQKILLCLLMSDTESLLISDWVKWLFSKKYKWYKTQDYPWNLTEILTRVPKKIVHSHYDL